MSRTKKEETKVEDPVTFLETVNGKLPNKDSRKLTEIRNRLAKLSHEVTEAHCHHYGLKNRIYFKWREELSELQRMFDTP